MKKLQSDVIWWLTLKLIIQLLESSLRLIKASAVTAFYALLFLLFSLMLCLQLLEFTEFFESSKLSMTCFALSLDFDKDLKSSLDSNSLLSLSVLMKQSLAK